MTLVIITLSPVVRQNPILFFFFFLAEFSLRLFPSANKQHLTEAWPSDPRKRGLIKESFQNTHAVSEKTRDTRLVYKHHPHTQG